MRPFELRVDSSRRVGSAFFAPRTRTERGLDRLAAGAVAPAGITLIATRPVSPSQKLRHLCYWRQVLEADNN